MSLHTLYAQKRSSTYEIIHNFNVRSYRDPLYFGLLKRSCAHDFKIDSLSFQVNSPSY